VIDAVLALRWRSHARWRAAGWQPLLVAAILDAALGVLSGQGVRLASMFGGGGLIDWNGSPFGLGSPGYGLAATVCTLAYLWFPYMVLPIFAGLERVAELVLEASGDLGRQAGRTLARWCFRWRSPRWWPFDLHLLVVAG